jgi:SAM-dependent methyltransferase
MKPDENLKKGWKEVVLPEDLDAHMEATEQGPCNAELVRNMLSNSPLPQGSKILIPGCGTGQLFDYLPDKILNRYKLTCTDINLSFIENLRKRLESHPQMNCTAFLDDIEQTGLNGSFDGVLAILLLEHTDWEKVIESISKLQPQKIYIIIQENKISEAPIINTQRKLRESIRKFASMAKSHKIDRSELIENLAAKRYELKNAASKEVPDSKIMTGLVFEKVIN